MAASIEERDRILTLLESGQITAQQAGHLLDAIVTLPERPIELSRNRTLRIWMSDVTANRQKIQVTATIPGSLVNGALRLWARLVPQLSGHLLEDVLRAIESGNTGRILDLQDLEEGRRVEIFLD